MLATIRGFEAESNTEGGVFIRFGNEDSDAEFDDLIDIGLGRLDPQSRITKMAAWSARDDFGSKPNLFPVNSSSFW